jgi:hypothetical protein
MRLPILVILAVSTAAARADGFYLSEGLGGVGYSGDLARFNSGAPRFQVGAGITHGHWGVEAWGAGMDPMALFIDCYGEEECAAAAAPQLSMMELGFDVRRTWRAVYSKWTRHVGIDFVLHAGPRYFEAYDALAGYHGMGLGGGATIDLNLKVFSMFIDFSTDFLELHGDGPTYLGRLPTIQIGGRLGWL